MRIPHDPNAVLDYRWDWSEWLDDDEHIVDHSVSVTQGAATISTSADGQSVTAWVSDAEPDAASKRINITCRVTTTHERTDKRTIRLYVSDR
jgi:hypothetical protein